MLTIGIDASRANKKQRTGTEWYSYFLIEELKKTADLLFPRPDRTDVRPGGKQEPNLSRSPERLDSRLRGNDEEAAGISACEIRFILYSREPLEGDLGKLPPNFESRVLRWPPKFFWTQKRLSWEMLVRPPDVLFVPAHALPFFSRAKMVVTIHDIGFRVMPRLYSKKDIWYHRFSTWVASRFAFKIICPSEFTKNELVKYYPAAAGKVHVVPHGVKPMETAGERVEIDHPYFLFVGRLEEKKNILNIVKAFEQFSKSQPRFRLRLVGRPGYGFERVDRYIKSHNLNDKIWVSGYVPESRKRQLYASAAALVFPTLYEGFGLPILEAQSFGCPVITSDRGANQEVAGDGALLVDPNKPEDIAKALGRLVGSPELQKELSEKGRRNSVRYTWRACAERTLQILTGTK